MKNAFFPILVACLLSAPMLGIAQKKKDKNAKDTVTAAAVPVPVVTKDTVAVVIDTPKAVAVVDTPAVAAPKDCFQDWYEKMRARGAKAVTDGMHPVIITLKSEGGSVCLVGQIQVTNGKMVPPLMIQQEDGEYKSSTALGKKLDPVFASSMTEDQLFAITDGMSVLFRTTAQEYGRLIFYTFANKGTKANKTAPSPDELLQE